MKTTILNDSNTSLMSLSNFKSLKFLWSILKVGLLEKNRGTEKGSGESERGRKSKREEKWGETSRETGRERDIDL